MKKRADEKTLAKWSGVSIIVATACCWLPLMLLLLGIIDISTVLAIGYRSVYFFAVGFALMLTALYFYWSKGIKTCCINRKQYGKYILSTVIVLLTVLSVTYFIKQIVLPYAAPYVYELYLNQFTP